MNPKLETNLFFEGPFLKIREIYEKIFAHIIFPVCKKTFSIRLNPLDCFDMAYGARKASSKLENFQKNMKSHEKSRK